MPTPATPVMSAPEVSAYLDEVFPQIKANGDDISVRAVSPGTALVRLHADDKHLRPGGTVSGPTMFMLSDLAAYAVILAHIGRVALAVTTNLNINFLMKPQPGPLDATAMILKLGKRLVVTDISIRDSSGELVAHATATYSIPPRN
ncbi:PaaI family thioesterase [Hoeflea alexandrii]|uniref:Hotdog fold thioesterase n=1 Tax=Hoeflea alexandrii TaxID=288436 RepID=A0ABT1CVA0_9HYPH|nr:PaaI family thioesterase [Hoeflea alexandrii]MCO6410139.1 hotdog fold thioesterase [Hoeflea alexandrii]MCY0153109.1 PaaI family thioesterase [Hoeflea alexandrii]